MIKIVFDVRSDHGLYSLFRRYIHIRRSYEVHLRPSFNTLYLRVFLAENILLRSGKFLRRINEIHG